MALGPDVTNEAANLNVQACLRLATLADEIAEPAASRVFARSPFGYGHDPAGLAASVFLTVVPAGVLVLLQAVASALTAMSNVQARAVLLAPIRLSSWAAKLLLTWLLPDGQTTGRHPEQYLIS